jgi:AAA+ ATPase superfamily predicted ATPase
MHVRPLSPRHLRKTFKTRDPVTIVETWAAWGGVPRYWELASPLTGGMLEVIDHLVLDPLGPLHEEPSRLLTEEVPPALEVRPVLDAIGLGAHRVSEIAGRSGHKATSLSRPLARITEMDLVVREVPFGESEKSSRRSLYRIADPFLRLWFRTVAPHRAYLASARRPQRIALLKKLWPSLVAESWEELCRAMVTEIRLPEWGSWSPSSRWWHGNAPEWDVVSECPTSKSILLGEARWTPKPMTKRALRQTCEVIASRPPPSLPRRFSAHDHVRALFIPVANARHPRTIDGVHVIAFEDMLA